jgi:hypothetical protein
MPDTMVRGRRSAGATACGGAIMFSPTALAAIAAASIAFFASATAQPDTREVGQLKDLYAWTDRQPPGPPSFHVIGKITAPTPCQQVVTTHVGPSDPFVYRVRIATLPAPRSCTQEPSDLNFHYQQRNYEGQHDSALVLTDRFSYDIPVHVTY